MINHYLQNPHSPLQIITIGNLTSPVMIASRTNYTSDYSELADDNYQNEPDLFPIEEENMKFFSYSILNEVKEILPEIAAQLKCEKNDLLLLNAYYGRHMFNNKTKDFAVSSHDINGLKIQYDMGLHKANNPLFTGFLIYKCRDIDLHYAVVSVPTSSGERFYLTVIEKGNLFQFKRYIHRQQKNLNTQRIPILDQQLIDDVIRNSVGFLLNRKKLEGYDVKIRRGIILSGDPGNGKTLMCRWIQKMCDEKDISWGVVTASEIERVFAEGHGLDGLFNSYQVTFFDDIDINYLRRDRKGEIACAILSAMDGINQAEHIVRIFTTNESIEDMDPAFIRPGRIDKCFKFHKPTREHRERLIIERWHQEILGYLNNNKLLEKLLDETEHFSFAELEAVRTILVTNKLMKTNEWNLEDAMNDFYSGRDSWAPEKIHGMGFSTGKKRIGLKFYDDL
jgi:cell division protease FtsH